MVNLKQRYEITDYDDFLCNLFAKIRGTHKISKYIRKRSKKKYGVKDNLSRYFMHKYRSIPVGKYTYGFTQFYSQAGSLESIGAFCSIAHNVSLTTGNHPMHCITTHPIVYQKRFMMLNEDQLNLHSNPKVIIGHDVWIGRNVTILPGVKIGNGAVIGAGAVVNRDIPSYAVAVGVPAKIIKFRFAQDTIDLLNEVQWWNWGDERIRANISLFENPIKFLKAIAK